MPAMLGCSTTCPKCQHQFACCPPTPPPTTTTCCNARRSLHVLSGGGLVTTTTTTTTTMMIPPPSCPSPQVSPSVPLAFVLPPFAPLTIPSTPVQDPRPEADLKRLTDIVRALRLSDWYYEGISYQQSQELLKDKTIGTFLVRESSDPNYLFSLSVQTERGPTSVRLHYVSGYFRLDAQSHIQSTMPLFPSVIELIEYYVAQCKAMCGAQVWVDAKGKVYSSIFLDKPLRRAETAPSLKHLSRMAVHKAIQKSGRPKLPLLPPAYTQLELPKSVTNYLAEYPYSI